MPELIPAEPGSPEWLAARRAGVTATDIGTILGLNPRDSAYSLYWRKLGQVPEVEDNDRFRLGRELEPYIMGRWGQAHPDSCYDTTGPALWRSTDRPWQMASTDSVLFDGEAKETKWGVELPPAPMTGVLECKTSATHDGWGSDGTADMPPHVRAQVLWQMDVMGVAAGHVGVVFLPSGEFRSYVIEHDCSAHGSYCREAGVKDLCPDCAVCTDLDLMRAAGEEFMARLRLELPAPDPDASAATLAAVRARFARQPDKEAEVAGSLWQQFSEACERLDIWQATKRDAEIRLREQAGEASVLTVDGEPVARRYVMDQQVKAHTRHMDYLKRIKQEESDQ